jgi:hypothetical protein
MNREKRVTRKMRRETKAAASTEPKITRLTYRTEGVEIEITPEDLPPGMTAERMLAAILTTLELKKP